MPEKDTSIILGPEPPTDCYSLPVYEALWLLVSATVSSALLESPKFQKKTRDVAHGLCCLSALTGFHDLDLKIGHWVHLLTSAVGFQFFSGSSGWSLQEYMNLTLLSYQRSHLCLSGSNLFLLSGFLHVSYEKRYCNITAGVQVTAVYFNIIRYLPMSRPEKGHRSQGSCCSSVLEPVFTAASSVLPSESRITHQELLGHRSTIFIF